MKARKIAYGSLVAILVAGVGATTAVAVDTHKRYAKLDHGQAYSAPTPGPMATRADAQAGEVDMQALARDLGQAAKDPALGTLHGVVTDITTGQAVWQSNPDDPLIPASSTKVLTAAVSLMTVGPEHRITTDVVAGDDPGTVVIKAAGDVWMASSQLDKLADGIRSAGVKPTKVVVDKSAWSGPATAPGWNNADVDGGFSAPMEPVMINGARLNGQSTGDTPRSHTPSADVAAALAKRLGASATGEGNAPDGAKVLASTTSEPWEKRAATALKDSDNVMAEALAREAATAAGKKASFADSAEFTLSALKAMGIDTSGVTLKDNSGLSTDDRIPPRVFNDVIGKAITDDKLRPLLELLPIAGADGTLSDRFTGSPSRGWVRAKTGTLTGTNALVGEAVGQSGHMYSFALLSNDSDMEPGRAALDHVAATLRKY